VAFNQGPVSFFAEARDAQRFPTLHLLDLRASKFFRIRKEQRLEVILDVFNAFNKDTTTNLNVNTGTAFNNPVSILGPRVLRLGARYTF
jgi:outer membrane receptor protein involved in Fe transport